ncbi:MAG TPA: PDZ domain-containing protein, partial [Planctomycetota bacterium]|nr:PDZ domain-containing protein [Planctomycetota bacterium]
VEQMAARPEAPARPAPPAFPARPGFRGPGGSTVLVQSVNGDSTYRITPGDGAPAITFHKDYGGAVKLDYPDEKGETRSADAPSIETFVKDHPELATKFGITEEGIEYGGTRVSFKGALPGFAFPRGPNRGRLVLPLVPPGEEGLRAEGAAFERVSEALRSQLEIPEGQGLVVTRVEDGGRAQAAGLRKSDILLEIDGRKVSTLRDVRDALKGAASATVLRRGARITLTPEPPKKDF